MAKSKGKQGKHRFFQQSYDLHNSVANFDGGSCLSGHLSRWTERDSCSYRWQGIKKAKENPGPYDSENLQPWARLNGAGFPWAATGAGGAANAWWRTRGRLKNFETGFMPYTNQVHHIVPNAELRNGIDETVKANVDLIKDICDGLLEQKYNINYKDNMIILPTEWEVACKIGLPTHLGSHPTYSARIKARIMSALRPYAAIAAKKKEHPKPEYKDLKDGLDAISSSMYDSTVEYGQTAILDRCSRSPVTVNRLPRRLFTARP